MITTRYIQPKVPPPLADLDKAIRDYHLLLEEKRVNHNIMFAPLYKPFNWPKGDKDERL